MVQYRAIGLDTTEGLPFVGSATDTFGPYAGGTLSGDLNFTSGTVTGVPSPVNATDVANKAYVDSVAQGLYPLQACRLATAAALPAYTGSGAGVTRQLTASANGALTVDGVAVSAGDRVLVKDEGASHTDHGIYVVTQVGDAGNPWILDRADDFDEDAEVRAGKCTYVTEGSTQADTIWCVTTDDPITVDTTAIAWGQIGGNGSVTGGPGIDVTGLKVSVDLATNPGLEFDVGGDTGKLRVLADPAGGLSVGAGGLAANTGDGIAISANNLVVDLATNPGLEFNLGKLKVLPDPTGALVLGAGGLAVQTDNTTIQINGSNQLEAVGAGSSQVIEVTLTAEENLSAGDCVEIGTTADNVRQCRANTNSRVDMIGVAKAGATAGNPVTVVVHGEAAGVLSGAIPGQRRFVPDAGGTPVTYASVSSGNAVVVAGYAMTATDLFVQPQFITFNKQ